MGRTDLTRDGVSPYDHIDFRVRDVTRLARFYDVLMPALGFSRIIKGKRTRDYYHTKREQPFFSLERAAKSSPSLSRIEFNAATRADVDKVGRVLRRAGAKAIEGPELCRSYSQPYYAVFFEDPDGNKFEVCCRR